MKVEIIIHEIERISKIKDPETCQEEVIKLNRLMKTPLIRKVKQGNYYYFYKILEYQYEKVFRQSRESKREKLGRISLQDYLQNKIQVEKLIQSRDQDQLKKYLETY